MIRSQSIKSVTKILLFIILAGAAGYAGSKLELWSNPAEAAPMQASPVSATILATSQVSEPAANAARSSLPMPTVQPMPASEMRQLVIPQLVNRGGMSVQVTDVEAGVVINGQMAMTTLDISLHNPSPRPAEAELALPVPEGAVIKSFSFSGAAPRATAQLIQKDEAARTYHEIVSRLRDPALMEFAGLNLIRTSVFPLAANGDQKIRLSYEHMLAAEGDRVDYFLPRSDSVNYQVPWRINVRIKSRRSVSSVYSPTHQIETTRAAAGIVSVRVANEAARTPGAFRLSYLGDRDGVTATFFAFPDEKIGGGYFMMLASPPAREEKDSRPINREVTLVIDCSGSMQGQKLEQVKDAAVRVIEGLREGESFNLIAFSNSSWNLSNHPLTVTRANVASAREFIRGLSSNGGTNIHDAMEHALPLRPSEGLVPVVLFLTDGQPTVGIPESGIRDYVRNRNTFHRRIYTIGVGYDVNAPLLDAMASTTRGFASYVAPDGNVETAMAGLSKRLDHPLFADLHLTVTDARGNNAAASIQDLMPQQLPDLYAGDQIIVLGRYRGDRQRTFTLTGDRGGHRGAFRFNFNPEQASPKNTFVGRLWASRKIGLLVDEIRAAGADANNLSAISDPRLKELADQVISLSREFGILTEYTSFLAMEGTDLSNRDAILSQAMTNFQQRAMSTRSGMGAVNQSFNVNAMNGQYVQNIGNRYMDENMNAVSNTDVQQVNDLAFFRRGGRWVDSRLASQANPEQGARVVEFGTPEFDRISAVLAANQRSGLFMLRGEVLTEVDGHRVLIRMPESN